MIFSHLSILENGSSHPVVSLSKIHPRVQLLVCLPQPIRFDAVPGMLHGDIPFKIIINLNRVSTNLCKIHFGCCLGIDYKVHLASVFILVNFKVLGEISVSGEHQRILRALMKSGTQIYLLLPPKGLSDCI